MNPALPLIEVSGNAYDLGYRHGTKAATLVYRHLQIIEGLTGKQRGVLCREAMHFISPIRDTRPALVEEIRGLADGAGISFAEAMLCQVGLDAAQGARTASTAFAVTGSATADGLPLVGENYDLSPEYADIAIILHVRPSDGRPRVLMLTWAGCLGGSGINQYGLTHVATRLYNCPPRLGLPFPTLQRSLLERQTVDECMRLILHRYVSSAASIILCDTHANLADLEIRPEGVCHDAQQPMDCCLYTNHYLTTTFAPYETGFLPDSRQRWQRTSELIRSDWGGISVQNMKSILAEHQDDTAGICRHGAQGLHTIIGLVAEPAAGLLHVRAGPGCVGTWQVYRV